MAIATAWPIAVAAVTTAVAAVTTAVATVTTAVATVTTAVATVTSHNGAIMVVATRKVAGSRGAPLRRSHRNDGRRYEARSDAAARP
jgi:hypothetical protein